MIKVTKKDDEGQDEYSRGIIYNYEDGNSEFTKHVYTKFKCDESDYVIKSCGYPKKELVIEDEEDFFAAVIQAVDTNPYHEYDQGNPGREIKFSLLPRKE